MDTESQREAIKTEAHASREFITPRLVEAGWATSPHAIVEQRSFTNGRIIVTGGRVRRGKLKRADYLLYFRRDYPLAVVEAKEPGLPVKSGVQQAREYAEILAYNLDIKNPHAKACLEHADPKDLLASMRTHEEAVMRLLGEIEALLAEVAP